MNYLIEFDDLKNKSLKNFISIIETSILKGISLNKLKITELTHFNGSPIISARGIYIFALNRKIKYIGSSSSRAFVERIPAHIDLSPYGWFNTLIRRLIQQRYNQKRIPRENLTIDDFTKAAEIAFKFKLVLINFKNLNKFNKNIIKVLERILIAKISPELNYISTATQKRVLNNIDENKTVLQIVSRF